MSLRNLKIRTRLGLAFGLIAFAILLFSVFVVRQMYEFKGDINHYKSIQEEIKTGKELQLRVANIWQFITDASLTKDKNVIDSEARPNLDEAHGYIEKLVGINRGTGDKEHVKTLEAIKDDLGRMWEAGNRMFNAYLVSWENGNVAMDEYDTASEKILKEIANIQKELETSGEEATQEMHRMVADGIRNTVIAIAIISIAVFVLALLLSRSIIRPVTEVVAIVNRLVRGDLSVDTEVKSKDEIGQLMKSVGELVDSTKKITAVAKEIVNGNLKVEVVERSQDDTLMQTLALMIKKLAEVVSNVQEAGSSVLAGSQQMSSSASQMADGSAEQAASVEELSASMEEISATVKQSADNAKQTGTIAVNAATYARESGEAVSGAVDTMKEIANKISIIEDIAEQTNLLALNAAIEAARAGDHGKGFAVVAAEVRKLAERSQVAAGEINQLSVRSMKVSGKVGEMLAKLVPEIQKTAELVNAIGVASAEQEAGVEEINKAIHQLNKVIQQNAAASEQLFSTAEEFGTQSEQLQETIGFFDTGNRSGLKIRNTTHDGEEPVARIDRVADKENRLPVKNRPQLAATYKHCEEDKPSSVIINPGENAGEDEIDPDFEKHDQT